MAQLPLFPLPVVLLPGALLPLHVFEARYRRMVARCLEFDRRFGLLYHDNDRQGPFLMEEGRVGTTAVIEKFHLLSEGRSLVLVRGEDRFALHRDVENAEPYYEAHVRPFEDIARPDAALVERRLRSIALLDLLLHEMPDGPHEVPEVDPDGEVSFRLAATIQSDPSWHQGLLESRSEPDRLDQVDRVLEAAIEHCTQG